MIPVSIKMASRNHDFRFPSDETYKMMIKSLKLSKFESDPNIPSYIKARIHKNSKLGLRNGCKVILDRGTMKPILRQSEMAQVLKRFHDDINHPGRDTTRNKIMEEYAFCNLAAVSNYVLNCKVCRAMKQRPKNLLTRLQLHHPIVTDLLSSPNNKKSSSEYRSTVLHQVDVDIIDMRSIQDPSGQENLYLIQMVDLSSQFLWARALQDKRSKSVASFIQSVFLQFGEPKVLHTENTTEFMEEPFKEMLSRFPNVEHVSSHPRSTKENMEPLLKKRIREWTKQRTGRRTWETQLPFILSDMNKSTRADGNVPFEEMFLRPYVTFSIVSDESEDDKSSKGGEDDASKDEEGGKEGSDEEEESESEEENDDEEKDSEAEEEQKDEKGDDEGIEEESKGNERQESEDDDEQIEEHGQIKEECMEMDEEENYDLLSILPKFLEEQDEVNRADHLPIPSNRSPVLLFLQKPLKAVAIGYRCPEITEIRESRATKQFQFFKLVKVFGVAFNPNDLFREELRMGAFVLWHESSIIEHIGTTVEEIEDKIPKLMSGQTDGQDEKRKYELLKRKSKSIKFDILAKKAKEALLNSRLKVS